MYSFRDFRFILIAGVFMLLWWSRGLLKRIPGFIFGLLCALCREGVLRREEEKKHRQESE